MLNKNIFGFRVRGLRFSVAVLNRVQDLAPNMVSKLLNSGFRSI